MLWGLNRAERLPCLYLILFVHFGFLDKVDDFVEAAGAVLEQKSRL